MGNCYIIKTVFSIISENWKNIKTLAKKRNNTKKSGFTLLELLVVISIIALLASISLVYVSKQRLKARNIKRVNDTDQLLKAFEMYHLENQVWPPSPTPGTSLYCCLGHESTDFCFESLLAGGIQGCGIYNNIITPYLPNIPKGPIYTNSKDDKLGYIMMLFDFMFMGNEIKRPVLGIMFEGEYEDYPTCQELNYDPSTNMTGCTIYLDNVFGD